MLSRTAPSPTGRPVPGNNQFHTDRPEDRAPSGPHGEWNMSTKRKKRTNTTEPGPFAGLYSRHILRAVVGALELEEDHPLIDRTAQRFFRNSSPNAYNRRKIFLALGQTLIEMGFVPDLGPDLTIEAPPSARVYADSIQSAAAFWDAFMSRIQNASSWEVDRVTGRPVLPGTGLGGPGAPAVHPQLDRRFRCPDPGDSPVGGRERHRKDPPEAPPRMQG